jgi:hypothetical protein
MPTNYPSGYDDFDNPTANDPLNSPTVPHAAQHTNINDAVEAVQAELGLDPSGAYGTVAARLASVVDGEEIDRRIAEALVKANKYTDDYFLDHINDFHASTPPPPPPPPPLDEYAYKLDIEADKFTLLSAQTMVYSMGRIIMWCQPGESVSFKVKIDGPGAVKMTLKYALARESQDQSERTISFGDLSASVVLDATSEQWSDLVPSVAQVPTTFQFDASGIYNIIIKNTTTEAWRNALDLFQVSLSSMSPISLAAGDVVAPPVDPPADPVITLPALAVPDPGVTDFLVGRDGSLQSIIQTRDIANKVIRVPSGVHDAGWNSLRLNNFDFRGAKIVLDNGAVLRSTEGMHCYGELRNLFLLSYGGRIETDASRIHGDGLYFDATRIDMGANGKPLYNIWIQGLTVRPIPGTGNIIQRGGITLWGGDCVTVIGCDVQWCSGNAFMGENSAASGMSFGRSRQAQAVTPAHGARWLVSNNLIGNQRQMRDGDAADRNGIILDLWSGEISSARNDYMRGETRITDNEIFDVDGRGIHVLVGGMVDAPIIISGNRVHGDIARGLGPSGPKCGIGGYGAGIASNLIVSDNDCSKITSGVNGFEFWSFDGHGGPGVTGKGNKGTVRFSNSRGNTPPSGFIV